MAEVADIEEIAQFLEGRKTEETENIEEKLEELTDKTYFRSSRVRMYYATKYKEDTPVPFCEVRVWVISENPKDWQPLLEQELDLIERFYLWSIYDYASVTGDVEYFSPSGNIDGGWSQRTLENVGNQSRAQVEDSFGQSALSRVNLNFEIKGREENVRIDGEEAIVSWFRTGLPSSEWMLNRIYRYYAFFGADGSIKNEYVESLFNFRNLLDAGMITQAEMPNKTIPSYEENWNMYERALKFNPDERDTVAMLRLSERDKEWQPGYQSTYHYKDGTPYITVRDAKGQFVDSFKPLRYEMYQNIKEYKEDRKDDWQKRR